MNPEYKRIKKKVEFIQSKVELLREQQVSIILKYIEKEAQEILETYPELTSYVQGLGAWAFYDLFGTKVFHVDGVDLREETTIARMLYEYDDDLHVTGEPLRVTKDLVTGEIEVFTELLED